MQIHTRLSSKIPTPLPDISCLQFHQCTDRTCGKFSHNMHEKCMGIHDISKLHLHTICMESTCKPRSLHDDDVEFNQITYEFLVDNLHNSNLKTYPDIHMQSR